MSLITPDYFIGEINIVGWESSSLPARERLCNLIIGREPEFLEHALGYSFSQDFINGIAANDAKFLLIKNGGTYTHQNGKVYRFNGLAKNKDTVSAIANYIYYWWCRNNETQTSSSGEVESKSDNASNKLANSKAVRAFNVAARECVSLWEMLRYAVNEDKTPKYPGFDYSLVNTKALYRINVFGL